MNEVDFSSLFICNMQLFRELVYRNDAPVQYVIIVMNRSTSNKKKNLIKFCLFN